MGFFIKQSEGWGRSCDNEEIRKNYGFLYVLVGSRTAPVTDSYRTKKNTPDQGAAIVWLHCFAMGDCRTLQLETFSYKDIQTLIIYASSDANTHQDQAQVQI